MNDLMRAVQVANNYTTNFLTEKGYVGDLLEAKIVETREDTAIIKPNTQDHVLALAGNKTHGGKFKVTGGTHITSDNFFKSTEIGKRDREIVALDKVKVNRPTHQRIEDEVKEVFALGKEPQRMTVKELCSS